MFKINCPNCKTEYELEDKYFDQKLKCGVCDFKFTPSQCDNNQIIPSCVSQGNFTSSLIKNASSPTSNLQPIKTITCPHCWKKFDIKDINYISRHIELVGDSILGPDAQIRFIPSRFSPAGIPLDAKGIECHEKACPNCHLKIPEALMDYPSSYFSIIGAPASGKTYFLTTMLWEMRKCLSQYFEENITDVDMTLNMVLNDYEMKLFLNDNPDQLVALPKTELQGKGFSTQILLNDMPVDLPNPFIFTLTPIFSNNASTFSNIRRNLILYDNAGEHFEPGQENVSNLATFHLMYSDGLIFLFDPLQDSRFKSKCGKDDPQTQNYNAINQLSLFYEMANRIRSFKGLHIAEKYKHPLVIAISKFDVFRNLIKFEIKDDDFLFFEEKEMEYYLNIDNIINVSFLIRQKLLEIIPELVGAAESFAENVYYLPVSALGTSPKIINNDSDSHRILGISPSDIHPFWVEVPLLLLMYLQGYIKGNDGLKEGNEEISQYQILNDTIRFIFPGSRKRYELPKTYCGHNIFSIENGKYYKLPIIENEIKPQETSEKGNNTLFDNSFWNN